MRKTISAILSCFALVVQAQDVITMQNGDEIQAKVLEITSNEVKYKKWSNQNGPSYTENKSNIFMIKYQNGDKDVFGAAKKQANESATPTLSAGNGDFSALMKPYNTGEVTWLEPNSKEAAYVLMTYGIDPSSQIADDNIELKYYMGYINPKNTLVNIFSNEKINNYIKLAVVVTVKNKTNSTLYLDLGNSFYKTGEEVTKLYTPSVTTNTKSGSGGASVNLGAITSALGVNGAVGTIASGINVGGGNTNTTSTTVFSERVLAIPPTSTISLPVLELTPKGNPFPWIYDTSDINVEKGTLTQGQHEEYTPQTAPHTYSVILSYSNKEECNEVLNLTSRLYLRSVLGTGWNAAWGYIQRNKLAGWDNPNLLCANYFVVHTKKCKAFFPVKGK